MNKLRTMFGIDDDLQAFAQDWLGRRCQLSGALSLTHADGALVSVLYRDDRYQVELCAVPGGLIIPRSTFLHTEAAAPAQSSTCRLLSSRQ